MPASTSLPLSLARWLKADPYRDLFRVLADTLEDAVLVLHPDGLTVLAANHPFLLLSGYSRDEVENLDCTHLLAPPGPSESWLSFLSSPHSTEKHVPETPLHTREALDVPVDVHCQAVGSPPSAFLLRLRPTSARLIADGHRLAQQERLSILTQITDILLDGALQPTPRILPLAARLLCATCIGLYRVSAESPEYVLEGDLPNDFPKALASSALDPLHKPQLWFIGRRPRHAIHKAARAAGLNALHSSPVGSPTAWIGLLLAGWRDQTEIPDAAEGLMTLAASLSHVAIILGMQRVAVAQIERELQHAEQAMRELHEAIGDGLLALDPGLTILGSNSCAASLLGYSQAELAGMPIQDILVGPEDVMPTLLDATGHQRPAEIQRLTIHRRDGTPVPVHLRAFPTDGERAGRLLLFLSDQSERQAMEDQHELLTQRALLGEVSAIFAHEVRNPINNISTGVQLAASRLGRDHPLYDTLERVNKECTRLNQLMSDVLMFARPLELKMETTDLAALMDRILGRWKPRLAGALVKVQKSYSESPVIALIDPRTFEQVIVNLLNNAIQAMPGGGTISVTLTATSLPQGRMAEIKVADTGPGIPQETLQRIFDPFFTTKKTGTGLGLAISRRILAAHKGGIQVESYPDAGSVFTLHVPALH